MKKTFVAIFSAVMLLGWVGCMAQQSPTDRTIDVDLWPNGLPNSNGIDKQPFDFEKRNYKPSIRVFLPAKDKASGRAVVALPGGGYGHLAITHEGYNWAPYFNELGIALVVVTYRMPRGNHEVPFSDATEALRVVRENAAKWNINPKDVGIMGGSAGGHLASTVATHTEPDKAPNFQILLYPVISADNTPVAHMGVMRNLLGASVDSKEMQDMFSNEKRVTPNTPRAFIAFSDNDQTVSPLNGTRYYTALKENNVPASLFIYPSGSHGWGIKDTFPYKQEMLADLTAWLKSF